MYPAEPERHHAFAVGRAFFKFCVRQHFIDRSPMEDMEPPAGSPPRERVLSPDELRAVYNENQPRVPANSAHTFGLRKFRLDCPDAGHSALFSW